MTCTTVEEKTSAGNKLQRHKVHNAVKLTNPEQTTEDLTSQNDVAMTQIARVVSVVMTYLVISVSMIFANKYLVGSGQSDDQDFSLFVAWVQCCVAVGFLRLRFSVFSKFLIFQGLDRALWRHSTWGRPKLRLTFRPRCFR